MNIYLELTEKEIELNRVTLKKKFYKKKRNFINYMELFKRCRHSYSRNTYL